MLRDVTFELEATITAARSVNVDHLNQFATLRADAGGAYRPAPERDLHREVLEELADARNYLVWWMQRVVAGEDDADPVALSEALGAIAHAYGCLVGGT